jgi:hypothetical protein
VRHAEHRSRAESHTADATVMRRAGTAGWAATSLAAPNARAHAGGGAGAAGHRAAENRGEGVQARTGEGNGEEGRGLASWVRERRMGGWGRTTGAAGMPWRLGKGGCARVGA